MSTMTRDDVVKQYGPISEYGTIQAPGKFEGEMVYVPSFWFAGLEFGADADIAGVFRFDITADDKVMWPELADVDVLFLEECESGFVDSRVCTFAEAEELTKELEDSEANEVEE